MNSKQPKLKRTDTVIPLRWYIYSNDHLKMISSWRFDSDISFIDIQESDFCENIRDALVSPSDCGKVAIMSLEEVPSHDVV